MTIENDMAKNLESFATDLNARRASQERLRRDGAPDMPSARAEWLRTKIKQVQRWHHLEPSMDKVNFAIVTGMLTEYQTELEELEG